MNKFKRYGNKQMNQFKPGDLVRWVGNKDHDDGIYFSYFMVREQIDDRIYLEKGMMEDNYYILYPVKYFIPVPEDEISTAIQRITEWEMGFRDAPSKAG